MFVDRKAALRMPDSALEAGENIPWKLTAGPRTSVAEILHGNVPRAHTFNAISRDMYRSLSLAPLSLFSASRGDTRQTVMVGPPMTGDMLLHVLSFPSTHDTYPLTPAFFFDHWDRLAANKKLQNAHQTMPGWGLFRAEGGHIGELVREFYHKPGTAAPQGDRQHDFLYPIIRWETKEDGSRKILLDPPERGLLQAVQQETGSDPQRLDRFNSIMGLVFLASFSPGQTNWPLIDGYSREDTPTTQDITGVQMMGYVAREVARAQKTPSRSAPDRDIQQSPLLAAMEQQLVTV